MEFKHPTRNVDLIYDGAHTFYGLEPTTLSQSGGSDLDRVWEHHGEFFIIERKHVNCKQIPLGQMIMFKALQKKLGPRSRIYFLFHGDNWDGTKHTQQVYLDSLDDLIKSDGVVNLKFRIPINNGIVASIINKWWNSV